MPVLESRSKSDNCAIFGLIGRILGLMGSNVVLT